MKEDIDTTIGGVMVADAFAKRIVDNYFGPSPFETDEIIEVEIPKYEFYIKVPYFRYDNEYSEIRIGFTRVSFLKIGKRKIKRKAMIWESNKNTGKVLKIKRYSELDTNNERQA